MLQMNDAIDRVFNILSYLFSRFVAESQEENHAGSYCVLASTNLVLAKLPTKDTIDPISIRC